MKEFFERIGSSFFVAAFVPSLGFLILVSFLFQPVASTQSGQSFQSTLDPINQSGLLLLIGASILGFTLSSLGDFVSKVFQGDYLFERFNWFKARQVQDAQIKLRSIENLNDEILRINNDADNFLENDENSELLYRKMDVLRSKLYTEMSLYQRAYPPLSLLRPTQFGNVIRSIDYYVFERYGIDRSVMWHRLIHSVPEQYYNKIEQSGNSLAFTLNCSVLSFAIAIISISNFLIRFLSFIVSKNSEHVWYIRTSAIFLIFGILGFWGFHYVALKVAAQYGNMIRSAFDLFRFELLSQMKLELPKNSSEEYDLWQKISEFMELGRFANPLAPLSEFKYKVEDKMSDND